MKGDFETEDLEMPTVSNTDTDVPSTQNLGLSAQSEIQSNSSGGGLSSNFTDVVTPIFAPLPMKKVKAKQLLPVASRKNSCHVLIHTEKELEKQLCKKVMYIKNFKQASQKFFCATRKTNNANILSYKKGKNKATWVNWWFWQQIPVVHWGSCESCF